MGLGRPVYMADQVRPGTLIVKAIHCPYPFAEVESLDSHIAEKVPGFVRLFTWQDTNIITNFGWNYTPFERNVLNRVGRYEGDVVALVAAETEEAAERARNLVKIKWKPREPLMDFTHALESDILVHGDHLDEMYIQPNLAENYRPERNQVHRSVREYGDADAVLARCDHVTRVRVYTPQQIHTQLETHRCYSYYDDRGYLTILAPTQAADAMQEDVARSLGIDRRKLRVIKSQVGGGFGGKNIFSPYCWCALVTYLTGRPASLIFSREEAMVTIGSRHEYMLEAAVGTDRDGTMRAIDVTGFQNAGAYSEISEDVMETGIKNSYALFPRVDALRISQYSVFTNKMEGCAFRGFGATQNCFLLNVAARHIADELQLDLSEVFLKNIARLGDSHPVMNGWMEDDPAYIQSTTLAQCIHRSKELIGWDKKRNRTVPQGTVVRGVGIGISSHASGVPRVDRGNVNIAMNADGSFCVFSGHADIGTGSNTVILQIVGEVLGVSPDHIHLVAADTACTPFDPGTYASSNTYRCGGAAKLAAEKMKTLLWKCVRETANLPADEPLEFRDEVFYLPNGRRLMDLIEFADKWGFYWGGGDPLVVSASFPDTFAPSPYVATCAEVEVDKETGYYRLVHMSSAIDCGRVLNPINARVQAMGGITQSIGMTMFEEIKYGPEDHRVLTRDMQNYKIPCQMDMPTMDVEFVECEEPTGPFGAKSLGEIATGSPAPAISDALFNALGIHFDTLPITPEKVLRAIQEKEGGYADS